MAIKNTNRSEAKQRVHDAWWAGVKAVNGYDLVANELTGTNTPPVTHVLALGKAAASMMLAANDHYHNKINALVITKYGHLEPLVKTLSHVDFIESGHPVPDRNSLIAGDRAIAFIDSLDGNSHLLVLVSGGASSLVEKLKNDLCLADLQSLNDSLLSQDKTIAQINAARSEISLIKKGRLLNQCKAKSISTLAISDVRGDDIYLIGSGIGACDLPNSTTKVIGSNKVARDAVCSYLMEQNINVVCNRELLYGDVFEVSKRVVELISDGPSGAYILGGETVVKLPDNPGLGGRNQSLALAIARELKNQSGIVVLVAGSDGTDGPTQAAGGIVDSSTIRQADVAALALDQANAGEYLRQENALFITGPTGTNVMDLLVALKV